MNVRQEAARDAAEFARAQMFFGDGAGTRRHHIAKTVEYKSANKPGYRQAFEKQLEGQDMVSHAKAARNERRRRDASAAISRNVKAAARGDLASMNTSVIVIAAGIFVAYKTGADRKAVEYVKFKYRKLKRRFTGRKSENVVYNITDLH